ncbi:MAG: amidohydrolase [Bacillota bacterium]|nr:amidohydrolase [Bacillota bacterium]
MITTKDKIYEAIEKNKEKLVDFGNEVFKNPELGYKENNTKKLIKEFISDIELSDFKEYAITGMKATIGRGDKLHIGLLCDMDATPTINHPYANKEDNGAHSCGHNSQMTIMLGVFKAFAKTGIHEELNCKVSLITAPAEEFVDFQYRLNLVKEGKIKAFSGKQNLILEGAFDDVDVVLASHGNGMEGKVIETDISNNGFLAKTAYFKGKSAHAGAYPHLGKNALNAATLAINAVGLLRETFQDEDHVRFHPIIKKGGDAVNAVPDNVELETYVRAASVEAIFDANEKIDNAFIHSAKALRCECSIENIPGYLPSNYFSPMAETIVENAKAFIEDDNIYKGGRTFASDDLSDVSAMTPVIQIGYSGFEGDYHNYDFKMKDEEMAYIIPGKVLAGTAYDMMKNIKETENILKKFKPTMKKEEYIKKWLKI